MSDQKTIVLLYPVMTAARTKGTLYYFAGNFFWPMGVHGADVGRVARAIREFIKANRALVLADRARPDYLSIEELCDVLPYDDEPARFVKVEAYGSKNPCKETEIGSYFNGR